MLCYGSKLRGCMRKTDQYKNPDNDLRGPWTSANMAGLATAEARPNLHYDLINPETGINYGRPTKGWRYDRNTMARLIAENKIIWPDSSSGRPRKKQFLAELEGSYTGYSSLIGENLYTRSGSIEQLNLWGEIRFDFPKNSALIQELLEQVIEDGDIVLDSFAGLGTTAHTVLSMNKLDNGHRRFILIEMEDYADTITAERVKRVISGYGNEKQTFEGTGGSFSFYELGDELLKEGQLNEAVGVDKIREYICYTETKNTPVVKEDEPYYLGTHIGTAYYFYYEKGKLTTLSRDFLHTVKTKADGYVIYADLCTLSDRELEKYHITFKKIPRDIKRL